jgi:hypothetical protein
MLKVSPCEIMYNHANLIALANLRFPFLLWPSSISHLPLERGKQHTEY